MAGALVPMAIAWRVRAHLSQPVAAAAYDLPDTRHVDGRLIAGAVVFGIGWGVAGLCPGPAVVGLVLDPARALLFVVAMLAGMALHRVGLARTPTSAPTPLMRTQR